MLTNYTNETYLKGFVPELSKYLWTGETTFDAEKTAAEQMVLTDFFTSDYEVLALRPNLDLRTDMTTLSASTNGVSTQETYTKPPRLRLGYNVTVRTGTTSLTLQGSSDEVIWFDIATQSVTATGAGSFVFTAAYKFYRINCTITAGTLAFTAWLCETIYDLFFAYKWLWVILSNAGKGQRNKYTEYANMFDNLYGQLWAKGIFWENGEAVKGEDVRFGK